MKHLFLFIGCLVLFSNVRSQNLVVNGSFEEKAYCPVNYNLRSLNVVSGWSQLNEGTPDYFNVCSDKVGVPSNIFGNQPARDGEAYAGFATYSSSQRNYREYITSKLSRPLNAGELVCIEMWISDADFSRFVTDGVGVVLSEKKLTQERALVVNATMSLSNPRLYMLDDTENWILISDVYKAVGGEEYITIGNFKADRDLKIIRRTKEQGATDAAKWAYIYVDHVSVTPVKDKKSCSCENEILASLAVDPPLELSEYDNVRLDAVLFDFDKDELTPEAVAQLEEVYTLLRRNKSMYLEIDGHTDSIGNAAYNESLSKRRAQRVISYLADKGIDPQRLTLAFFGSSKPALPNDTDEGRAQNRRVEFHIRQRKYELVQ